ncbi:hypothetical protein Glove_230g44 [Diversispora epigaea]|uniref:TLDc domain-containing protein n=1 Tax=Diversispora epigaea TaxID=1348612 RepID=A0A397ICK0_9GLOM|nr:hypothetical protein Glove_230g44 [Diversispora epigaea]
MDTRTMYDLLVVTNELEFEKLSKKLENHLIQSKASWLRTHFAFIYHGIFKHNKFKKLENFCNNIIVKQLRIIFVESAEFSSLYESALVSILKCDDLQMNEKEIWDYVINYSLTNNPYVSQLLLRGSKDGFAPRIFWNICNRHNNIGITKVEGTNEIIGGFNPLACNKTNKSFIFSFKGGNIQNSILSEVKNETYALHDYDPTFGEYEFMMRSDISDFTQDKKIRCYTLKEILAKVIEFYSLTNNPYVSQLLLRGSKDGFAPRIFWNICNRHNNIGITKVEGTNEIIGGFNPLACNKTNKSFIFSFKGGNIQNSILSEVKNETYALRYSYYNKR